MAGTGCIPGEPTAESCAAICGARPAPGGAAAATPGAATPAAAPAASGGGHALTDAEYELLQASIDAVRIGVAAQGPEAIGICKPDGRKCGEFLGTEADLSEPGDYIIYAEFRVPRVGPIDDNKWQITFETECVTTSETGESSSKNSKDWKVQYSGSDERGYTLSPLWKVKSPSPRDTKCDYKVRMPKAGGENVVAGSWKTPRES